jgi:hypothetical protein
MRIRTQVSIPLMIRGLSHPAFGLTPRQIELRTVQNVVSQAPAWLSCRLASGLLDARVISREHESGGGPKAPTAAVSDQGISPKRDRKAPRRRALKDGKIVSPTLHGAFDVGIRDLSASGALIEVPLATKLPSSHGFLIVPESKLYPAVSRRRHGDRLGMEFTRPPKTANLRKWRTEGRLSCPRNLNLLHDDRSLAFT